jgi:protein-S-isoprenylcysteine O-methyltransferase Ste14
VNVLLPILHGIFFTPVLVRLAGKPDRHNELHQGFLWEVQTSARQPILLLHGAGLILLWGGLVYALVSGQVERPVTLQGLFGALLILAGTLLMVWSHREFGSWRLLPKIDTNHQLCTTGPYAMVRHPMYLAIDLLGLGTAVWAPTALVIIAASLLFIGGDLRARVEENALIDAFGDLYRSYRKRVARLIPGLY